MIVKNKTYPIAEVFTSPQGEGVWSGTRMRFIRLAGCNVGKYKEPSEVDNNKLNRLTVLNPKHAVCTTSFGQEFLCDTDYHKAEDVSVKDLLAAVSDVDHICITGGEPFLHDLTELVTIAVQAKLHVHIETSGTLSIPPYIGSSAWITCSPKLDFLPINRWAINEYKFVVSSDKLHIKNLLNHISEIVGFLEYHPTSNHPCIYIQPVNGVDDLDFESINTCLELQKLAPHLAISIQMHKVLRVR